MTVKMKEACISTATDPHDVQLVSLEQVPKCHLERRDAHHSKTVPTPSDLPTGNVRKCIDSNIPPLPQTTVLSYKASEPGPATMLVKEERASINYYTHRLHCGKP